MSITLSFLAKSLTSNLCGGGAFSNLLVVRQLQSKLDEGVRTHVLMFREFFAVVGESQDM